MELDSLIESKKLDSIDLRLYKRFCEITQREVHKLYLDSLYHLPGQIFGHV